MPPKISVILSAYNGMPYLSQAIQSILGQSMGDFELILVNDASTDGSRQEMSAWAARDKRVRLIDNESNLGLTRSLNLALLQAEGQYIARQDADDISQPQRLQRQLEFMDSNPELVLTGCGIIEMDEWGREGVVSLQPSRPAVIKRKMLFDNAFFHPTVIWRRHTMHEAGLHFNEDLRYAQDYELFSRVVWRFEVSNALEPLVKLRSHRGQVSKNRVESQQKVADRVAWLNYQSFGLGQEFDSNQVELMRRLGIRSGGMSRQDREEQWNLWQRLFARLEKGLTDQDWTQWKPVKRSRLGLLRRNLAQWPPLLGPMVKLAMLDPMGSLNDIAGIGVRRLARNRS